MKTFLLILLFLSSTVQAARFIVEAKQILTKNPQKKTLKISPFVTTKHDSPYFKRLYVVEGEISKNELQQMSWVRTIEEGVELTRLSLLPAANSQRLVNDELFAYQWGLQNQGQTYLREKDDIHNLPLLGIVGKDVDWKAIYQSIPTNRPVVAVLDSGVDLTHPDLTENLWKNAGECGLDPKIDNDQNKFPGDCHGWNFTEPKDSDEAKDPQDLDGHGTHVAGIIAASRNGIGMVGVNPNALIMPVKVMKDANSRTPIAASESFALGIIYATDMGAQIINLSLGWPRSLETSHLRNAINYALNQNVIIVAAAGNNNSSEPLFPCAYDGVICTAASTLDGAFAGFSNYGGHVDTVAPGEGILSLNPVIYAPDFFSIPGYDIKSGTSQSAPLLAGLISILKAQRPQLTIDEVFARLYQGTSSFDQRKYTLGGEVSWGVLNQEINGSIVRPLLKRVRQIVLQGEKPETRLSLPFRNYGLETEEIKVRLESLSPGLEVLNELETIDRLRTSEVKSLVFKLRVNDFSMESNVRLKVTVSTTEGERTFFNEVPITRDVKQEARFRRIGFKFRQNSLPLGNVEDGKIISYLNSLESYGKKKRQEFFLRRILKDEKKLVLTVFHRSEKGIIEAPVPIIIENFSSLTNFFRLDLNLDGKDDYFLQAVVEDERGEKHFQFWFFDENLAPLWPAFHGVKVIIDLLIKNLSDFRFARMDHPQLGRMMIPVVFTEGQSPKLDQQQDFFGRWDIRRENHLYYLEPMVNEKNFRLRTFTHSAWREQLKKDLRSKWSETVLIENILTLTDQDEEAGRVRVLVSVGLGSKRQISIASFDGSVVRNGRTLSQIVLQTESILPLLALTPSGPGVVGDAYLNIYDRTRAKIVNTKESHQSYEYNYQHEGEMDLILGQIAAFENGLEQFTVLQTRDELVSLTSKNGTVLRSVRPKLRYSFFSSKVLSELYLPVVYRRTQPAPALYVDSTSVTGNRVYLFEEQQGRLVSSVQNSLIVPLETQRGERSTEVVIGCKALNPAYSESFQSFEFIFLCLENKEWFLRTYEMR